MWDTYRDRKNLLSNDNSLRHRHSILSSWNIWSEVVRKDHFYTHYREGTPVKYPHHCHLSSCYITQITVSFKNQEQTFSQMYSSHTCGCCISSNACIRTSYKIQCSCKSVVSMWKRHAVTEKTKISEKKNEKIPTGSFYSANGTVLVAWPILVQSNLQARGIHMQRRWSQMKLIRRPSQVWDSLVIYAKLWNNDSFKFPKDLDAHTCMVMEMEFSIYRMLLLSLRNLE